MKLTTKRILCRGFYYDNIEYRKISRRFEIRNVGVLKKCNYNAIFSFTLAKNNLKDQLVCCYWILAIKWSIFANCLGQRIDPPLPLTRLQALRFSLESEEGRILSESKLTLASLTAMKVNTLMALAAECSSRPSLLTIFSFVAFCCSHPPHRRQLRMNSSSWASLGLLTGLLSLTPKHTL